MSEARTATLEDNRREHAIIISQQQMLRAGNQVLYRTVDGYLKGGFTVTLIVPSSTDPELADANSLFPGIGERLRIVRVTPVASTLADRIKRLRRASRAPSTPQEPATFADPRTTLPFHPEGRVLTIFTLAAFSASAMVAAVREWRRQPADVVVGFEFVAVPTAYYLARRYSAPVVAHYQGTFLGEVLGKGRAAYLLRFPADYLGTALRMDMYFMLNDGTRGDEVLADLGVAPERVRYRVSGVRQDMHGAEGNRSAFLSAHGIPDSSDVKLVVTLSKLTGWKRIERAILAMPGVIAKEPNAHLLIAHRGPLRDSLEALATRLGLSEHVHFIGPMSHGDVKLLLSIADVFLSVNDHSNLSNPLLEAMTAECAIITIADGSTAGLLKDGANARLVDLEGMPDSLTEATVQLLGDPVRRKQLAAAARHTAVSQLTSWEERIAVEVEEVRELLRRREAQELQGSPSEKRGRVGLGGLSWALWLLIVSVAYFSQFRSLVSAGFAAMR